MLVIAAPDVDDCCDQGGSMFQAGVLVVHNNLRCQLQCLLRVLQTKLRTFNEKQSHQAAKNYLAFQVLTVVNSQLHVAGQRQVSDRLAWQTVLRREGLDGGLQRQVLQLPPDHLSLRRFT